MELEVVKEQAAIAISELRGHQLACVKLFKHDASTARSELALVVKLAADRFKVIERDVQTCASMIGAKHDGAFQPRVVKPNVLSIARFNGNASHSVVVELLFQFDSDVEGHGDWEYVGYFVQHARRREGQLIATNSTIWSRKLLSRASVVVSIRQSEKRTSRTAWTSTT